MVEQSESICCHIVVKGIVQGVGFRPFVYRLAHQIGLRGWVANTGSGVEIEIAGAKNQVEEFLEKLESPPPLAVIDELQSTSSTSKNINLVGFLIQKSGVAGKDPGSLPPDADICPTCLEELFDPADSRYLYPFINCTDCGPRYTVIENIPYDRPFTTMKDFQLCSTCAAEFQDPADRRFHAQTNCCPSCGPHYSLCDKGGRVCGQVGFDVGAINESARLLKAGKILAIKGIGGFHLVADARNNTVVKRLRQQKRRAEKPLAIMAANLEKISQVAVLEDLSRELICSAKKPIVILRKKEVFFLAQTVAPDTVFIGLMLPYSPLHYLLFASGECDYLVMTSGNIAGAPIIRDNDQAFEKLAGIADYFLVHDRDILISNDDSVIRCENEKAILVRRSRSYAPASISLNQDVGKTLAFGAMLKNTICLTRGKLAFFSHHIGELQNPDTAAYLKDSLVHFKKSLRIEPDLVVCDLHPEYPSTLLAQEYSKEKNLPLVQVQHHFAHAVSCMAEHRLGGKVLAIVLDGSGLGLDSTVWGGEILVTEVDNFKRAAHLFPVAMPGGDIAVLQPWRMALSYLYSACSDRSDWLHLDFLKDYQSQIPLLLQMIDKDVNCPQTSSCGRLFDAMAVLLGLCQEASYEGQAASGIEMLAKQGEYSLYSSVAQANSANVFDTCGLFLAVLHDLSKGTDRHVIAARFQNTLALYLAETCQALGIQEGVNQVVLSGGVFLNLMFSNILRGFLEERNFSVYSQDNVVPGDGGIALGQAVAGRAMFIRSGKGQGQ